LKEVAPFAVEVGQGSLGAGEPADGDVAQLAQSFAEQAQGGTFAGAGIAAGQSEAAFADLLLDAPAEVLDGRGPPESRGGDLRGEGIELEAVEGEEFFYS